MLRPNINTSPNSKIILFLNSSQINNIDGANLRNEKSQEVLAKLAAIEHVFVIATIDHIHAPLLWDEDKAKLFNWIW